MMNKRDSCQDTTTYTIVLEVCSVDLVKQLEICCDDTTLDALPFFPPTTVPGTCIRLLRTTSYYLVAILVTTAGSNSSTSTSSLVLASRR